MSVPGSLSVPVSGGVVTGVASSVLHTPSLALSAVRPEIVTDIKLLQALLGFDGVNDCLSASKVYPAESYEHVMRCFLRKPQTWEFWFVLADRKVVGLLGYQVRNTDVCVRFLSLVSIVRDPQTYRLLLSFVKDRYQHGNKRTQTVRAVTVLLPERDVQAAIFLRTLGYRCEEQYVPGRITKQFPQGVPSVFGLQTCYLFRERLPDSEAAVGVPVEAD